MKQHTILNYLFVVLLMFSCNDSAEDEFCNSIESQKALKKAVIKQMKKWEKNADYASIVDFEAKVETVVEGLEIVKSDNISSPKEYEEITSCRCSVVIQFKNHDEYKELIKAPVDKVRADGYPINNEYLGLTKQMNYLDNEGFEFSYLIVKLKDETLEVLNSYPFPAQINIDNLGGLVFDYILRTKE